MTATCMTLFSIAAIIVFGIWLTGLDKAHWLLCVPPAFLVFAAVTGCCPGLVFRSKLGLKSESLSCEFPNTKK